jgi:hypothetical protein
LKPILTTSVPFLARRSMAAAAVNEKIYFFGGVGANGTESILDVSNDLWCFDAKTLSWTSLTAKNSPNGPSRRRCVGFASAAENIYLWGGSGLESNGAGELTYTFLNDLWVYHVQRGGWEMLEPSDDYKLSPISSPEKARPEPRYTPVWHVNEETSFIFSGYTEDRLGKRKMNDLWLRHNITGEWQQIEGGHLQAGYAPSFAWPGVRYGTMSASNNTGAYICGGFSDAGDHNDIWRWSWSTEQWECLSPDSNADQAPAPRYSAACVLHEKGLWIFGGRSRRYPKLNFNDTWRFDLLARRWEQVQPQQDIHRYNASTPGIGYHAKSSNVAANGVWYLWGGEGLHGHVSDFWRFDFTSCEWQMLQPARDDDPRFW